MNDGPKQLLLSSKYLHILGGLTVLAGLYLASLYSYLLFHSLAELFSVVVAWSVFMLAWNSRSYLESGYLLLISVSLVFVGALDLLHTLAYKGMGVFRGYDANLPTQLWIAARYLQGVSLLLASLLIKRSLDHRPLLIGYGAATSALLLSIFYWHIFPDCFIEGKGLTPFKIFSEYVISFILLTSAALFILKRRHLDGAVLRLLIFSIVASTGAEIAFTQYISVYGFSNLLGHFLKIISFYFIYRAIIVTGLVKPYNLVFRDLKLSKEALDQRLKEIEKGRLEMEKANSLLGSQAEELKRHRYHLEELVEERTAELREMNQELEREISERRRAREMASLFESLVNQTNDAIFVVDPDTAGFIDVNSAAWLSLGYERSELLGMKVPDIALGQPDMARWKEHVEQLKEKGHLLLEDVLRRRDGSTFPVEVSVKHVAHEERDYLLAIVRDVTERKEIENRITASNELLKLFSQSFTRREYLDAVVELVRKWSGCRCVGIRVMDEDSKIPYEAYTGFSREFWERENWLSAERDECVCIRVIKERPDDQELPVITSNGSFSCNDTVAFIGKLKEEQKARYRGTCIETGFLSVAVVPIRYRDTMIGAIHLADEEEDMVPPKTVEFIELISPLVGEAIYRYSIEDELRKNYEALRKSEKSLSEAQRIAQLGNWEWNLQTNELHWSEEIYRIFGLSTQTSNTNYVAFLNYVHPNDREFVKSAINAALYERKPYSIEHRIVLEDGTVRIVHEQGEVNYNDSGEPVRMVGTVQDITERKLVEEKLRSSREQLRNLSAHLHRVRERERTSIAREIHDELGQTLTALKMDVSWLGNKYRDHEPLAEKTKSMIHLIDSTIRTVKRISAELRPVVLDDLGLTAAIEWQAEEFQKRSGIECEVKFDPEDITMDKDRSTTVFRIFQEALTNVIRHAEATRVKASLEAQGDRIIMRVEDNGRGITEKEISDPRSFGLIGIRERVHYFGGEVKIRGAKDKGTSVEIFIPLEKAMGSERGL